MDAGNRGILTAVLRQAGTLYPGKVVLSMRATRFPASPRAGRVLLLALLCLVVFGVRMSAAPPPPVIKGMTVYLDDAPVDIGPVVQSGDSVLIPVGKAVRALTYGEATGGADTDKPYVISAGGKPLLRLDADGKGGSAEIVGQSKIPLDDAPETVANVGGAPKLLMMEVHALAGLLGISTDIEGRKIFFYTPQFWAKRAGIKPELVKGHLTTNRLLQPVFGVSPPARSLLLWVRPSQPAFVQVYGVTETKEAPRPFFGVNSFDEEVTQPDPTNDKARARAAQPDQPIRADTLFYTLPSAPTNATSRYASYVAVTLRKDIGAKDPVAAINAGEVGPDDWSVVGLRQAIAFAIIRYDLYTVAAGETLEAVAQKFKMSAELLRNLNGLRAADRFAEGTKVVVLGGLSEGAAKVAQPSYSVEGYYEAHKGDTIASLSKKWGVSEDDFLLANSFLPFGVEPEEGEILVRIVSAKKAGSNTATRTNVAPSVTPTSGKAAITTRATALFAASGPQAASKGQLAANTPVTVLFLGPDKQRYLVSAADQQGWVAVKDVADPTAKVVAQAPRPAPAPNAPPVVRPAVTAAPPGSPAIVTEAVKWVGVPRYQMGGNELGRAIDCSHFVASVFARLGIRIEAPVHDQETRGTIVHWHGGPLEEYDRVLMLGLGPSLSSLRPGDRIIMQVDPTNFARQGNHHTGIYIGRYGNMAHAVIHCNSSRNTVSIDDLTTRLWRIYRYAVRGTQKRPPGQFIPVAQSSLPGNSDAITGEWAPRAQRGTK